MNQDQLTPAELAHFHQRLARREAELADLLRHCQFADESGDAASDFKVLAEHAAQAAVEDAQASQAVAELKDIRAARLRMDLGEYGACTECGEPIGRQRLEALPATAWCAHCRQEQEEGRAASGPHASRSHG